MATSREERMQQRMRGAGRHEVADDSFNFVLPGAGVEASPERAPTPPARSEPNTSAKRRRLEPESAAASSQSHSSASRASRSSQVSARLGEPKSDPYNELYNEPPVHESEPAHEPEPANEPESEPPTAISVVQEAQEVQTLGGTLSSPPEDATRPVSRQSVTSRPSADRVIEEVTESPATAPGSGHRRRITLTNAATQSAKLQKVVIEDEAGDTGEVNASSPLAQKTRRSVATESGPSARSARASTRSMRQIPESSPPAPVDRTSPLAPPSEHSEAAASTGSARSTRSQTRRVTPILGKEADQLSSPPDAVGTASPKKPPTRTKRPQPAPALPTRKKAEPKQQAVNEEAEEIDVQEAARRIGRKRPRPSPPREESPELHSQPAERGQPSKKARTKRTKESPAKQSQPRPPKKKKTATTARRRSDGEAIPITVQRYTKRTHQKEDDTDEDILASDIPFANRSGVNVIDVLLQMCDEVIESSLEKFHEAAVDAKDSVTKKEFRTKLRALEAFQEELRTRLLEHTIALDNMHALKKRVRTVQKEKLALRAEILRIRAEREQVALKMDAVRIRHETANQESLVGILRLYELLALLTLPKHQLGLSSTMDDIELAIENGKTAPELDRKAEKAAELANLELLIAQVAGQATAAADGGGGALSQIKEFNAFLERAAAALEGR
ncbi:hypothetical protein F4780DRAFT_783999 [Xylariomycetidae sp. FL0641]|nr:hypothetical protein F4780DRAFT_783999 [Xylariomycetidae sp. FL0641]